MSEQQAEAISGEPGSAGPIAPNSSDVSSEPVTASLEPSIRTEAPDLVPDQAATGEAPEVKAPEVHATEARASKPSSSPAPGKLMIMSPGDRAWTGESAAPQAEAPQSSGMFGKRRFAAMAAVVVLATVAGALGGALATASFGRITAEAAPTEANHALEATVARIDADVVALKTSVDHTSKMGMSQFNKTSDRLDKLEKAQAEPAAKLAKLSEAVEKLHATPAAAPAVAAAPQAAQKEVTGSVTPPSTTPAAVAAAGSRTDAKKTDVKNDVGRLPTVDDWILRDVGRGGALIEGRQGIFEVYAGDPVPGLGRVDAIRRQDGHWVVVTSRGLIVAR
ncbi:hypothetical protein [Bradyrhizobium canariense]|uniref:Uncharacterized protein n=1 Tax=Bradyrhizobium canariense TaxID=255045 RepID=A0A1H1X4D7_9BRAD|nr:hypothetical protein [Bradyrhizobium canariense]SDT03466.1 hypothetical protein SAMN05444158_4125 [Bradyrhizobium canariense]